jgi:dihydrofolate reductase
MTAFGPRVIYRTATSLDGFIADDTNSLAWLFAVEQSDAQAADYASFLDRVGVLVEGSSTYEWVLAEASLLELPSKWREYYGERPTFVFTSRELPRPAGADVRFVSGPVSEALPLIIAAASSKDVWVVGGGDLAGQFLDAQALDEITVSIAPVTLAAGASLFPRRLESSHLTLVAMVQHAQFIHATYRVTPDPSARSPNEETSAAGA